MIQCILRSRRWCSVLAISLSSVLSACIAQNPPVIELEHGRQRWETRNIDDYQYTLKTSCFCIDEVVQPVVIQVRDGMTSLITTKGGASANSQYFVNVATIPKLFDLVQNAIHLPAADISVTYDPSFGFPEQINIDYIEQVADDEISYVITDFAPR